MNKETGSMAAVPEKPKKLTAEELFRNDESFKMLREELKDSVGEALAPASKGDFDILPLQEYIAQSLLNKGVEVSDFEKEKLFWGFVFDSLDPKVFSGFFERLSNFAKEGKHIEGEREVKTKILDLIQSLSPTAYRAGKEVGLPFAVFSEMLRKQHPDLKEVFNASQNPEEKAKAIRKRIEEEEARRPAASDGGEKLFEASDLLEQADWARPSIEELILGATILVKQYNFLQHSFSSVKFRITAAPYKNNEAEWMMGVEDLSSGAKYHTDLANWGIVPYKNNKWHPCNRPIEWHTKVEDGEDGS